MLARKRTDDGWVDRTLASLTPTEARQRLLSGARTFDDEQLRDATADALVRMDPPLRAELARVLDVAAEPLELGEMFFEPPVGVDAAMLASALQERGERTRIEAFLARNPRAASAYSTEAATRLIGSGPPPRRSVLPAALGAGLAVFGAGALIALGALLIPKEDDAQPPQPPAVASFAASQPAVASTPPAHVRRNVRPRAQHPHHEAQTTHAAPKIVYVEPSRPARAARAAPRAAAGIHRPRPHPVPRPHTSVVPAETAVAETGPDQRATPAPHVTVWKRIFGWMHLGKRKDS